MEIELDNIKALWQKTNDSASFLNTDEIKAMLRNEGKGALDKLIKWERVCFWLVPVGILVFWGTLYMQSLLEHGFTKGLLWLGIIFSLYAIYSFVSCYYKYKFLKKIDMVNTDIITVSRFITKYKKFVILEYIAGFCWAVPFLFAMVLTIIGTKADIMLYVGLGVYSLVLLVIAFYIVKRYYFKHITTIQQSIKEIREFEQDEE